MSARNDNEDVVVRLGDVAEIVIPAAPLMPEAVHEPDTRRPVKNVAVQAPPYSAIHLLYLVWPDHTRSIGTAWAVSPHTLVTAGHNLLQLPAGITSGVRVFRRGEEDWVAPVRATTVSGWRSSNGTDHRYDYGALLLPPEVVLPPPYLAVGLLHGGAIEMPVRVAGFPYDKPFGTMWEAEGLIAMIDELLRYDVDTEGGQSGAPVMANFNGSIVAVGLHVDADPQRPLNVGVRFDPDKIAAIDRWKA